MTTDTPLALAGTDRDPPDASRSKIPAVSVEALTKTYRSGESAVRAVDDVTFDVEPGTVVGLLGPNGAGKTTVIKSILGLVAPTSGDLSVRGVDPSIDSRGVYEHVAAVLEGARNVYWRLTVRENLDFSPRSAAAIRTLRRSKTISWTSSNASDSPRRQRPRSANSHGA